MGRLPPGPAAALLWAWATGLAGSPCAPEAAAAIRTVRPAAAGSPEVVQALQAPTHDGRVEALVRVLRGPDIPAALEAAEALAGMGPAVVPRLVSEMGRAPSSWVAGSALVKMGPQAVAPLLELLDQADEAAAVDCIYLLGEIRDRRAIPSLIRNLDDPRPAVRRHAVTALLRIGSSRSVEAVLARMSRQDKDLRQFIADALLRHGRSALEPLARALETDDAPLRREAAYLLGELGDPAGAAALRGALADPDVGVRRNAAYALGRLGAGLEDRRAAVGALIDRLADPSQAVAEAARGALVALGTVAVEALIARSRPDGPAEEVVAALNALREIGDRRAEGAMLRCLDHPARHVRVAAVAGLVAVGTSRALEPLLHALRDEDLRWIAGLALERLGAEAPALFLATAPNDPTVSFRTRILVHLGGRVVPTLTSYLKDDNVNRKAAALWVLGEIGDPRCARPAAALLADPEVGWLAARCLAHLGEAGLSEILGYLRRGPPARGALQAVDALALFDHPRAWDALEAAVSGPLPKEARVRAAVRVLESGGPERAARVRAHLADRGSGLRPSVEAALSPGS
ncbi:MAG: hypothetical protein Kow0092_06270 [Deferrisomatales bacterium]